MNSSILGTEIQESTVMLTLNSLNQTATPSSEYSNSNLATNMFSSSPSSILNQSVVDTNMMMTQETSILSTLASDEVPASSVFENTLSYSTMNTLFVSSIAEQSISQSSFITFSQSFEQTSSIVTQTDFISSSTVLHTASFADVLDSSESNVLQTRTSLVSESHVLDLKTSSVDMYSSGMVSPSQRTEPMTGSSLPTSASLGSSDKMSASVLDLNSSIISTAITPNFPSSISLNVSSTFALYDTTNIIPTSSYYQTLQTSASVQEVASTSIESSSVGISSSYSSDTITSFLEPSLTYLQTTSNITSLGGLSSLAVEITSLTSITVSTPVLESYIGQSSSHLPNITITSSPVISPSTTLESEKDMASASVTPHSRNVTARTIKNITCEIKFDGDCELLTHNKVALGEFWEAFVVILSDILPVRRDKIKPKDIACGPIRLSFYILDVESPDLSKKLADYVNTRQLSVPILLDSSLKMYTAITIEFDPDFKQEAEDSDIFAIGLRQVDIIVIISACLVSLVLICVGFFICAREYYLKKRTRSFDLSDVVHWNMNMEDYTLTKIPRPKTTYTDKGVKMNSFRKKNGSSSHELKAQVENIPSSEVKNGKVLTDVQVRMDSNSNGLIVGVTGTSDPLLPTNQQSPTYSNRSYDRNYDSEDNLYEEQNSPLHCADNPIYYADDDRFSSV